VGKLKCEMVALGWMRWCLVFSAIRSVFVKLVFASFFEYFFS